MRKKAHFDHNQNVLQTGQGTLLVEKGDRTDNQDNQSDTVVDYWGCPECLGFYHRKGIRAHVNKCNKSKSAMRTVKSFYEAMLKTDPADKFSEVLTSMTDDEVGRAVKADATILKFGSELFEKYESNKVNHVSTKMREIGRVLVELRQRLNQPSLLIREAILELLFDNVIDATRSLCKLKPGQKASSVPSLALKVGHSMKK